MRLYYVILLFCFSALAAENTATDPMEWTRPTKVPEVRQLISDQEYTKQVQALLTKITRRKNSYSKLPEKCLEIIFVEPATQAVYLGIKSGDFILEIDGTPTTDTAVFVKMRSKTKEQILTLWSHDQGNYKVRVAPRFLGITYINFSKDIKEHMEGFPNDPRWSNEYELLAHLISEEPELAETALRTALSKGLAWGCAVYTVAAQIAANQFRHADAMAFSAKALELEPKRMMAIKIFNRAALSSYKLEAVANQLRAHPDITPVVPAELLRLIKQHKDLPLSERVRLGPIEAASKLYQDSLTLRSQQFPQPGKTLPFDPARAIPDETNFLDKLYIERQLNSKAVSNSYHTLAFGPGVKNVLVSFQFSVEENTPEKSPHPKYLTFTLFDMKDNDALRVSRTESIPGILGVSFTPDSVRVFHPIPEFHSRTSFNGAFRSTKLGHQFKLALVDGCIEMTLDGVRIFYGPLGSMLQDWGFAFKNCGCDSRIWNIQIHELMNEQTRKLRVDPEINKKYRLGDARLHLAAWRWTVSSAEELLNFGADINLPNTDGLTPLAIAVRQMQKDNIDMFLRRGATVDLFSAAGLGRIERVKELLKLNPEEVKKNKSFSPLHFAVLGDKPEIAQLFLDSGIPVDVTTSRLWGKRTPLIWTGYHGRKNMAELLLNHGAQINHLDVMNKSTLWYAEYYKFDELATFLKNRGANNNNAPKPGIKPPAPPNLEF